MATEGGGKLRKQRQHYRKPYESQKTLFYRVTDAVRGIWTHSWVSKLLPSSNVEAAAPVALDDALPGPSSSLSSNLLEQHQLRSSLNSNFKQTLKTSTSENATFTHPFGSGPSRQPLSEKSTQVGKHAKQRAAVASDHDRSNDVLGRLSANGDNLASSSIRSILTETVASTGDNQSETSEESLSTSGCSSLVPHVDKREYQKEVLQLSPAAFQTLSEELQTGFSSMPVTSTAPNSALTMTKCGKLHTSWCNHAEDDSESGSARTSLWSEPAYVSGTSKPQPAAHGKKPKFKASVLGSGLWAEKSLLNDSASGSNSTFYKGTTTYGGASAYGKLRLHQNTPYSSSMSSQRQIRVKSAKSATSDVDIMSATAKRILQSLEKMSTPVLDAKKIPNDHILTNYQNLIATPNYGKRPNTGPPVRVLTSTPNIGPPMSRLLTPTPVSITKVPGTAVNSVTAVDKTDIRVRTATKSDVAEKPGKATHAGGGGKMRSVRSELHYSSHATQANEEVDAPDLPDIPLPIKILPTFDFGMTPTPAQPQTMVEKKEKEDEVSKGFTFASPITLPTQKSSLPVPPPTENTTFGADAKRPTIKKTMETKVDASKHPSAKSWQLCSTAKGEGISATPSAEFKFSLPFSVTPPKPPTGDVTFKMPEPVSLSAKKKNSSIDSGSPGNNSPSSEPELTGGLQPASELKTGSVMDFLGKQTQPPSNRKEKLIVEDKVSRGFGDQFLPPPNSWECQVCLVRNKASATKCISCDEPKVKPQLEKKSSPALLGFGDKFKPVPGSWDCSSCMLNNKPGLTKCAACEEPKPEKQAAPASEKNVVPTSVSMPAMAAPLSILKSGEKMWDCETCWVQNKSDCNQCIACEAAKPGSLSTSASTGVFKIPLKAPEIAVLSTAPFTFGFKTATPATDTTITPAKTQITEISSSGSISAVSAKDGMFSFSAPASMATQAPTFSKPEAPLAETGFKFGVVSAAEIGPPKTFGNPQVAVSVAPSPETLKVSFGNSNQEQVPQRKGTLFGTVGSNNTGVSTSSTKGFLFGLTPTVSLKENQSSQQSVPAFKTSTFEFPSTQPLVESRKETTTTSLSIFAVAPPTTTIADKVPPGFKFALGQKDSNKRSSEDDFGATSAKKPGLGTSLPSFSTFSNAPITNTGMTTTTTPAPAITGFSFGVQATSTAAPVFGAMATSSAKSSTAAFAFGSSLAPTQTQAPTASFSGPTFGTMSTTPGPNPVPNPVFSQIPSSGVTFGSSPVAQSFTFGSTATSPTQNLFGSVQGTGATGANLPAFGSGSSASTLSFISAALPGPTTASTVPSFAAPTPSLVPQFRSVGPTNVAPPGGFTFGSPAPPPSTFQFGSQQTQQPAASGAFSFGSTQAPQAQQGGMFAFGATTPAAPSSVTFGATAPSSGFNFHPSNPTVFNFSGTSEPPTFAANANATADSNTRMRTIKKARRRAFK